MVTADGLPDRLAVWSPMALMLGGCGILGLAIAGSLDVTGVASSPAWLHAVLLLGGLWVVFVGLVGFKPAIADAAPRLALGGALASALGGLALTVGLVSSIAVSLTSDAQFGEGPAWGPPLLVGAFLLALVSFGLYGIASARTGTPSRPVGLLMLVPVAGFLGQAALLMAKIATGNALATLQLILAAGIALAIVGIGYLLRTDASSVTAAGSPG